MLSAPFSRTVIRTAFIVGLLHVPSTEPAVLPFFLILPAYHITFWSLMPIRRKPLDPLSNIRWAFHVQIVIPPFIYPSRSQKFEESPNDEYTYHRTVHREQLLLSIFCTSPTLGQLPCLSNYVLKQLEIWHFPRTKHDMAVAFLIGSVNLMYWISLCSSTFDILYV